MGEIKECMLQVTQKQVSQRRRCSKESTRNMKRNCMSSCSVLAEKGWKCIACGNVQYLDFWSVIIKVLTILVINLIVMSDLIKYRFNIL
jgi:hypothetical protein